jgi:hypothetical protein
MLPIVVDAIVIRILVVVGFLFTKKRRIWEFEESHGGVRCARPVQSCHDEPLVHHLLA